MFPEKEKAKIIFVSIRVCDKANKYIQIALLQQNLTFSFNYGKRYNCRSNEIKIMSANLWV